MDFERLILGFFDNFPFRPGLAVYLAETAAGFFQSFDGILAGSLQFNVFFFADITVQK